MKGRESVQPPVPEQYAYGGYMLLPRRNIPVESLICARGIDRDWAESLLVRRTMDVIRELTETDSLDQAFGEPEGQYLNCECQPVEFLDRVCRGLSVPLSMNSEGLASVLSQAIQNGTKKLIKRINYSVDSPDLAKYIKIYGLSSVNEMASFLFNYGRGVSFDENDKLLTGFLAPHGSKIRVPGDAKVGSDELYKKSHRIYEAFGKVLDREKLSRGRNLINSVNLFWDQELYKLFSQPPGTIVTIDIGQNSGVCLNAVIRQSANLEYTNTPDGGHVVDIGTQVLTLWVSPKDPAEPLFTLCDGRVQVASEEEMEYDLRKEIHFEIGFNGKNIVLFMIPQELRVRDEETQVGQSDSKEKKLQDNSVSGAE